MFRKPHMVKLRSEAGGQDQHEDESLGSDQRSTLLSIRAFEDSDDSNDAAYVKSGVGERTLVLKGPVVVHGYSVECFGNFFGVVYQGLSDYDTDMMTTSGTNGGHGHDYPSVFEEANSVTDDKIKQEGAIKNLSYLNGFLQDPYTTGDSEVVALQTRGMKWARTDLDKRLTRKSFKHIGAGKYEKGMKSGLVMLPNTDTEFFSINLKNLQNVVLSGNDTGQVSDGEYYARVSVWMSWDLSD